MAAAAPQRTRGTRGSNRMEVDAVAVCSVMASGETGSISVARHSQHLRPLDLQPFPEGEACAGAWGSDEEAGGQKYQGDELF